MSTQGLENGELVFQNDNKIEKSTESTLPSWLKSAPLQVVVGKDTMYPPPPPPPPLLPPPPPPPPLGATTLFTVKETLLAVVVLLEVSVATAVIVWVALVAPVESQVMEYVEPEVEVVCRDPTLFPSILN